VRRLSPWLAAVAGAALVLGTLVWVRADRRAARDAFPVGSVYNQGEGGASLAFAYLAARGGKGRVQTLNGPLRPGAVPAAGTVFRLAPTVVPFLVVAEEGEEEDPKNGKDGKKGGEDKPDGGVSRELRARPLLTSEEEEWVRAGGRLVLGIADRYGPVWTAPAETPVVKVFPLWRGVRRLAPEPVRSLAGSPLAAGHAVFLAGSAPVASRWQMGGGEVIALAVPEVFDNRRLGLADHLALLEALAGLSEGEGEGEGRAVRFDEYSHGAGSTTGPGEILAGWGLGPFLLLLAATAGVVFWRAAARLGPPDREPRARRSDAVELVDSLAGLYGRALGRGDAVRLYYDNFVHTLGADTGLSGEALAAKARQLAPGFSPPAPGDMPPAAFAAALAAVNDAFRRWNDARHR
jgi:hypothetical protein